MDVKIQRSDPIVMQTSSSHIFVYELYKVNRSPFYFLSDSSKDVDLEKSRVTNDADEMINWINGLTVSGGGDCPEYSLSGLITGATLSNFNSTIYIYTDAPAKDESRETEVIEILQRKTITPKFRLRNECGGRRKREIGRYKRQSSVYDSIAQATGGDVERFSSSQDLADKVQEDLMSELSFIQSNSSQAIIQNNLPTSISIIKWKSTHADQLTNIEVDNSSPSKGLWTLENIVSNPLKINITANSSFDISSSLREISSEGFFYPLNGNPVSGKEYVIVVLLENLPANSSISSIVLVDEKGNAVTTTVANLLSDLSLSNIEQLEYNITNHGGNNRSLTLDVSDDKGYIVDNRSIHFHISPGESENKLVFIRGTQPSTIVSSAIRPTCNLTSLGDTCQNQRGNGSNCFDIPWQGSAQTVLNLTVLGAAIGGGLAGIVILTTGVLLKIRHSSLKSLKCKKFVVRTKQAKETTSINTTTEGKNKSTIALSGEMCNAVIPTRKKQIRNLSRKA
uniref:Hemicentin-1 n=1 Tax=Magallana gigas TaxID=29159 RepID=K1RCH7_MAGGI